MPSVFISYRRVDSAALATLIAVQLKDKYAIDAYVDTRNTDGGGPFPDRLRSAIERSDIFVCLLGATTLQSAWVLLEIEHADNLRKIMIPVFQERYVAPSPLPSAHVEALLQSDGVQFLDVRNLYIDQAIAQLAEMIRNSVPYPSTIPPSIPAYTPSDIRQVRRIINIIGLLVFVTIILAAIILPSLNAPHPTITPSINAALNPSETSAPSQTNDNAPPTITASLAPTLTATPSLEIEFIVQTLDVAATIQQATSNAESTAAVRATAYAVGTQSIVDQTATATRWTATPTPNMTASVEAFRTEQAATATAQFITGLTATAALWTDTPTPTLTFTLTLTPTPLPLGFAAVLHNADWRPVIQSFDNFEMGLVPIGCFMMGSTIGADDEKPVNQQCFDQPFWIDRYEVTQKQFKQLGGVKAKANAFEGDNRPVENITWFEARDYCSLRGARLPTEAEWEYAVRGVDNLVYPWGINWDPNKVVWNRIDSQGTADVGSHSLGSSWIGVLDLSGNVWEWVSSLYLPYPYDKNDGREADTENDISVRRVLRGCSWAYNDSFYMRGAIRGWDFPDGSNRFNGFRCARDY